GGKPADDRKLFNEAHVRWKPTRADWGPHVECVPKIRVAVVSLCDQGQHFPLIRLNRLCQRDSWYGLGQNGIPVFSYDVAIGRPILDDVPKAIKGEQLKAG